MLLAGQSATFGYPEIDVGVIPAIHYAHLPCIIGRHRAFELLFSGRSFDAEEAWRLGLLSKVVPDAEVDWVKEAVPRLMAGVASFNVPLLAEVGVGANWEEAH